MSVDLIQKFPDITKLKMGMLVHTYVLCTVPADFSRLEATLNFYGLFSAVAAGVCVVVTNITLLTFFYNLVPTDGLITDWRINIQMK